MSDTGKIINCSDQSKWTWRSASLPPEKPLHFFIGKCELCVLSQLQSENERLREQVKTADKLLKDGLNIINQRNSKLKKLYSMFKEFYESGLSWNASRVSVFQQDYFKEISDDEIKEST